MTTQPEEQPFHILRGKRIEELSGEELVELHAQIEDELPTLIDHLSAQDLARLEEMELIEDELERRNERI